MPTYDYRCSSCGHEFEKFQPISAAALKKCPKCGKGALKRLIGTGAGIIFKGGGFYETDYRSENYKAAAKKEGGDGAKADTKDVAAKDAGTPKPAAASDAQGSGSGDSKPAAKQSKKKSA